MEEKSMTVAGSDLVAEKAVSEELAGWAAGLEVSALPGEVRDAVANTLIDTVGLSIAATETDYGQAVRSAADLEGGCTVYGARETRSPFDAALINGTTGHGEDFDNTYEGCPVHSGVVIVPALIAAGEAYELPSERVALGMAVGIEVMCRMGLVAQKAVHKQGFHPTSVLGTVAAALGVGVARGQSATQLRDTLGVSASQSSGIIEYLADGTWTKRMHPGWAAQAAIRAAAMGGAGFRGPVTVFEGVHGLYQAFAPSLGTPDFDSLTGELSTRWEAANVAFKPYACGTMTQPFIDCAVRLASHKVPVEEIEEVVCYVGEGTVHRLWAPLELKQSPPTPYAAKFSGPYTVAAGYVFGDAGLSEFTETAIADPRARAMAAKTRYEIDPDDEYPRNYTGTVELRLKSGQRLREHQPQLRGGTRQKMTRPEILSKCRANLAFASWNGADADAIAAFADGLFGTAAPVDAGLLTRR